MLFMDDDNDRSTRNASKYCDGQKRQALVMWSALLSHRLKLRPRMQHTKPSVFIDNVVDEGDVQKAVCVHECGR